MKILKTTQDIQECFQNYLTDFFRSYSNITTQVVDLHDMIYKFIGGLIGAFFEKFFEHRSYLRNFIEMAKTTQNLSFLVHDTRISSNGSLISTLHCIRYLQVD